jgi:hypothetical protein
MNKLYNLLLGAPNSYHATDKIYGLVTALPLLAFLEHNDKDSGHAIGYVLTTLFAIWMAESYAEFYKLAYKEKKHLTAPKIRQIVKKEFVVMVSANLILLPFVLELFGMIDLPTAYMMAQVFGILLLFRIGFRLSMYIDRSWKWAIIYGAISASFGLIIVFIKSFLH